MKVYADSPGRFLGQLLLDLLFVAWLLLWVWAGQSVHDATMHLAEPGRQVTESATTISGSMREAGEVLADLPLVGDQARAPFDEAAGAAGGLAEAGRAQVRAVAELAGWLRLAVAAVPVLLVAVLYLPARIRFARRATAGARLLAGGADLDLFALRALATQPLPALARVDADPVAAWRAGDRDVTHRLAVLELRSHGLRPPPAPGA